ncbi:hypothetical protein CICLE_v10017011mg [Citrus x clementina]|uniref:Saccharopine dehydrogenase NADP binding domain-containing protein n=1 Tax=Citrus clementina TaxID=85681 RepID=V4UB05_CITCL|nr:hypothetical protein CICLE_v10017011mg [Citrus x clementina]
MKNQNTRVLVLGVTGRVVGSTAVSLYKLCPNLQIVVGSRNREKSATVVSTLRKNSAFAEVNLKCCNFASADVDLVVHAAEPFQQAPKCTVLEFAMETKTAYINVCDDTSNSQPAKSFKVKAITTNIPAITSEGIYPGEF